MESDIASILFELFVVFTTAQIGAEVAQRLRMPSVVGEIVAGAIIGPYCLGLIHFSEALHVLAETGAVFLLFSVGLETQLRDLRSIGKRAGSVAAAGVIFPFLGGIIWGRVRDLPLDTTLFIGAALVATSAGITARVLYELKALSRIESRIILGAAVIDDILGMLVLGAVTALTSSGEMQTLHLLGVLLQAILFVGLTAWIGTHVVRKGSHLLEARIHPLSPLTIALAVCLGLASSSTIFGLAAIIGAFLAGMVMSEAPQRTALEKQVQPLLAFLVPFFFVFTGAQVNVLHLGNASTLTTIAVFTLLAIATKFIGCGLATIGMDRRSQALIATGMVPRGEVGIIIAGIGLTKGAITDSTYTVLISMSLLTSLIAPPVLKAILSSMPEADETQEMDVDYLVGVDESGFDVPGR